MHRIGRELSGEPLGAGVGHEVDPVAAASQLMSQRLGRKKMAPGSPGRKQKQFAQEAIPSGLCYSAGTRKPKSPNRLRSDERFSGLRRVSAKRKPTEIATAIIDEPP